MSERKVTLIDKFGEECPATFQHIDEDGTFIVICDNSNEELVRGFENWDGTIEIYFSDPSFDEGTLSDALRRRDIDEDELRCEHTGGHSWVPYGDGSRSYCERCGRDRETATVQEEDADS